MNRLVMTLFAALSTVALLTAACSPAAPTSTPAVSPTLAFAPPLGATTEPSPAVPTVPATVAPTAAVTEGATTAPSIVATPSAPNTPSAGAQPTTTPTAQATPGAGTTCHDNATFVRDVTVTDGTSFAPDQPFTKTWRLRNNGTCAWTSDYELVFVRGTNMTANPAAVPATAPGATADIQLPMTAPTASGTYIGFYQMRAPNGTPFGITFWVSIRVAGTPAPAPTIVPNFSPTPSAGTNCTNNSVFVADVTIPDGTQVTAGQEFVKTWQIRNAGTCAWGGGYAFAFDRGTVMTANPSVGLQSAAPGATVQVSVSLAAPTQAGTYTGVWRPKAPNGTFFGQAIWVTIRVGGGPSATPSATP